VDYARIESQNHRFTYNEPMSVRALTQAVSDLALNFGEGDPSLKRKPMVSRIKEHFEMIERIKWTIIILKTAKTFRCCSSPRGC